MLSNLWKIFLDLMSIKFIVLSDDPVARYLSSAEKTTIAINSILINENK